MKQLKWKRWVWVALALAVLAAATSLLTASWRTRREFSGNMKELASLEDGARVRLSDLTPFSWDDVYTFDPYTSRKDMANVLGFDGPGLEETVSEGMVQLIFVKDGAHAFTLCGYPENLGYSIDLGYWENGRNYSRVSSMADTFTLHTGSDGLPRLVFEGEQFTGTVLTVSGQTALVEVDEGCPIRSSGTHVTVSLAQNSLDIAPGSRVKVTYDGMVLESYPLQLGGQMELVLLDP